MKAFEQMGAKISVEVIPQNLIGRVRYRFGPTGLLTPVNSPTTNLGGLSVNVRGGKFTVRQNSLTDLQVLDTDRKGRHLLLMAKAGRDKQKFLCGHDERDWFVAQVPSTVTSVVTAKDSLRPTPVSNALLKAEVRSDKRHKRHNKAFIRQGEWFFVPDATVNPDSRLILHREPLVRPGGGKPHIVEELYRCGGTPVKHNRRLAPQGILQAEYDKLSREDRYAPGWGNLMRNPQAYARGAVRHADHATIHLKGWHQIHINGETRTGFLGFLD